MGLNAFEDVADTASVQADIPNHPFSCAVECVVVAIGALPPRRAPEQLLPRY